MTDQMDRPSWPAMFVGRTAIVTGGAQGLGHATVRRLADTGATVISVDLAAHEPDADNVKTVVANVLDPVDVERVVDIALGVHGSVEVLVNNVGGMANVRPKRLDEYELVEWQELVALNLRPAFIVTRALLRRPQRAGLRSIVNIGASLAERSSPHLAAYGAAKAAVTQLTRTLAVEYGREGIRANCVAPGFTLTTKAKEFVSQDRKEATARAVPLGRVALADEVADAVVFLASNFASFVSGQTIVVDGGLLTTTMRRPRGYED